VCIWVTRMVYVCNKDGVCVRVCMGYKDGVCVWVTRIAA